MSDVRRLIGIIVPLFLLLAGAWTHAAPAPERPTASRPSRGPMRVAFLNAMGPQENPWLRDVVGVMRAAAHDLDIQFVDYSAGQWPGEVLELARRVVAAPEKPDYLIISIHRGIGVRILEVAEQAGIPVFVINSGLPPAERARYGGPRQHFKQWIGQMLPDDEGAGYQLAWRLLEAATVERGGSPGTPVRLVALEGARGDTSATLRLAGLRRALAEWKNAEFLQSVSASWLRDQAWRKTTLLLRRYLEVQVIWAANDDMGLGALRALEESGLRPGEDVLVGGIDWTPESLQALREGALVTSIGGHFLEGAWALVLLHDYHHAMDFASERLDWQSQMIPLTRADVGEFLYLFREPDWETLDFRAFSKVANPGLQRYDFSIQALFAQRRVRSPGRLPETHGPKP
jgi:ABC-type sugar transport system substrate-binding protein